MFPFKRVQSRLVKLRSSRVGRGARSFSRSFCPSAGSTLFLSFIPSLSPNRVRVPFLSATVYLRPPSLSHLRFTIFFQAEPGPAGETHLLSRRDPRRPSRRERENAHKALSRPSDSRFHRNRHIARRFYPGNWLHVHADTQISTTAKSQEQKPFQM